MSDFAFAEHLPHDDFDVFVVDVDAAVTFIYALYFLYEVGLHASRPLEFEDFLGVEGTRGQSVAWLDFLARFYFEVASVGDHVGFAEHDLFNAHADDLFEGLVVEGFACFHDEFAAFVGDVFGAEGVGSESLMGEGFV